MWCPGYKSPSRGPPEFWVACGVSEKDQTAKVACVMDVSPRSDIFGSAVDDVGGRVSCAVRSKDCLIANQLLRKRTSYTRHDFVAMPEEAESALSATIVQSRC